MSQDKPTSPASLASPDAAPGVSNGAVNLDLNPEALVSTYADSLITSLFQEVDSLLEGDPDTLERVSASLALASPATQGPSLTPDSPPVEGNLEVSSPLNSGDDALALLVAEAGDSAITLTPRQSKTFLGRLLDRLLLLSTGLSLIGLVAMLWLNHRHPVPVSVPSSAGDSANGDFLQYLQRSLQVIEKKTSLTAQLPTPPDQSGSQPPSLAVLPPPLSAGDSGVGGPVNVIERVYVPYQTTQPAVAPQSSPGQTTPAPASSPTPGVSHRLVGVLELGDHSAALFEINDVPQRVYIGERIGTDGWSLVSVANQEVVIRRNGDVRSIYIGQQF